jgi:hypothetical protein
MKTLTEIYNQLREQVLPNTQTKGNANQASARGDTMSVATGAVPSVPKAGQAAHLKNNPRAGLAATSRTSAVKPQGQAVAPAPKPVGVVKKLADIRNPEMGSNRAREGSAERGHAAGSKFSQGPAKNAADAKVAAKKTETRERIAAAHKEARRQTGSAIAQDRREKGQTVMKAKDVPGLNKSPEAVKSAQTKSDAIIDNAKKGGEPQTVTRGAKTVSNFKKGATPAPAKGTAQASTGDSTRTPATAKPAEKEQSFGQAFAAARKKAGGAGGVFTYKGKKYQTNVKGEKYLKQSKLKSVDEATDHKELYKTIRLIIEGEEHTDHKNLGATHKPKQSIFKNTLGALEKRKWSGNQDRNANSSYTVANTLVAEKNTDTGEAEDEITVNPKEKSKANTNSNSVTQKL